MKVTLNLTTIQAGTLSDARLASSIAQSQAEREVNAYKTAMSLILDAHGHTPLNATMVSFDQGTRVLEMEFPDEKTDAVA